MTNAFNEKCQACGRDLVGTGRRGRPRKFCPDVLCQRAANRRRKARHGEKVHAGDWAAIAAATGKRSRLVKTTREIATHRARPGEQGR